MEPRKEEAARILKGFGHFLKHQHLDQTEFFKSSRSLVPEGAKPTYPIGVALSPYERIRIIDIVESDNKTFNKIVTTFAVLCDEIDNLQKEAYEKHYIFLAFYGEHCKKENILPEHAISNHIESLNFLTLFIKRCYEIITNFCNQVVALYGSNLINIKHVKFDYLLNRLGDLLVTLITIDCLVNCSPLVQHWSIYCKAVRKACQSETEYAKTIKHLKSLESIIENIEDRIFSDKIFQNCIECLASVKKMINKNTFSLSDEFLLYLRKLITDLEKSTPDYCESMSSLQWVKVNALFVLHFHIFGNTDKKLFKNLTDNNLKAHTVPLFGLAVWYPEQFLLRHVSVLCNAPYKLTQSAMKARQTYISNKKQTLSRDVYNAQLQISRWMFEIIEEFSKGESNLNILNMNHRLELLIQGVKFASQINYLVNTFMAIHILQGMPITKSLLMAICKLIELLKGIEAIFKEYFISIISSTNLIIQHFLYQVISKLLMAKKRLMTEKSYMNYLDELTAIVISQRTLRGPPTSQRRIVANIALSIISNFSLLEEALTNVLFLLERIDLISTIHTKMKMHCNCLFIYFHRTLLPMYFQNIFNTKKDMMRMKFLIDGLNDCSKKIYAFDKILLKQKYTENFKNEVQCLFDENILKPLGQQIETNLRLHVHSHLQLDPINPFTIPIDDNTPLLDLKIFRFDNIFISINHAVEHYLSSTFYNLTTVVLHDWKTYGEMRQLAKFKFNLNTIEDNLPTQTLEQGLDVPEIMRNIHVFVSTYLYNLNNQVFVEKNSNNKYLNTINIRHVANSIRTHGIGIMNTSVNFIYQYLRKKFHTFSQFMYDEQIKSRLIKDMRQFREVNLFSEQMYGYKRAEKFNKSIRNLGLNEDGQSYLDLFRLLISHIGNAMGYIRMIRSGGLHCCANATAFLPSLSDEYYNNLSNICVDNELVRESLDNLNTSINNLTSNFSQGTDYFKLLIDVFTPVLRSPDNVHLKTFYMIVPPLTLNFVENMLLSKDKLYKRNKVGAAFTDDGFAMGLAYILKLLNQDEGMDSLQWFQSVNNYISEERKSIADQFVKGSDHLQNALALTEKKLNVLEQEFQLLYFSFSSARIFFQ